ncbi:type VI secretion system tip protein VgrG [Myxococcus stipitatus]|uniref:type VI secretion system tip protein VgrG n=1 Tax=Myxococcus stipitatus TaxID=83455 RepID=UPI001F297606|nr:type VI secretion system tip protein VgrG [Myxococcus stipitatus]MCE9667748.1 type VI secretion system tip protein VgrG [Myxococcus stipitatus]
MPDTRSLPIPAAHREFTVKVGGRPVPREHQLLSVNITRRVNRIPSARLAYLDGAASASDFPVSNGDLFLPGREVEILAGPGDAPVSLFKGVVVRQSLKVRERSAPQLLVECRHKAQKLTVGRKSACYFDQPDSDILASLLSTAGVDAEVEPTAVTHEQLVQFNASDWDFLLARAEANGKLVLTEGDRVLVKAPDFGGSPVCTLHFGATLLELDAEIDARLQYTGVTSLTWDPSQQAVVEKDAQDSGVSGPGNLSGDDLATVAGLARYELRHAALGDEEAQAWADARWLRSRMCKVSGRGKCEGLGAVEPGHIVTLSGVGRRFGGDVFVTGVRHDFDTVQGWKTHVQFGGLDQGVVEEHAVSAPKAGALLPGVSGLQVGAVVSNEDASGEHRVRVRLPLVDGADDGIWARVASPDAGAERGFFFRPEVGDEVVVGFLEDDPRGAIILGMLHSSAKAAPLQGSDDNHEKVYQSRSRMRIYLDDEKKVLRLETPAGNKVTLSEEDQALKLEDQNGNTLEMTADGIKLESVKALELKAGTELKLESGTAFSAKGGTELKLEGTSAVEVSSTATTKIKGGIVQLN